MIRGSSKRQLRMLMVGAFPRQGIREHGGVLTLCRALLASSLPQRMELILVDSSSPTVPPPPLFNRLLRACLRVAITARRLVFSRPDVVLLFASPGASYIEKTFMAALARLLGIRTLMFPVGAALIADYENSRLLARFLRGCFHLPTLMLCQGVVYRKFFVDKVGLEIQRCPLLPSGIATEELLDIGASRAYAENEERIEILFLGWMDREKGVFELLECARRMAEAGRPRFRILMAGDGSALADVERYVRSHRLAEVVCLLGWIDADEKARRLRGAHMLILPSYMEGLPCAVIEAMAAGLPVVATKVGAVPDLVCDGVNGFVVAPKDVDQLCDALGRLLMDGDLRERMGRAGWRIAKEKFGVERQVDRLVELTSGVCA